MKKRHLHYFAERASQPNRDGNGISRAVVTAYRRSPDDALLRLHTGRAKRARLVNDGRHVNSDADAQSLARKRDGPAGAEELPSQATPSEEERRSSRLLHGARMAEVLDSAARPSFEFLEEIDH